jgi:hypothetical protein
MQQNVISRNVCGNGKGVQIVYQNYFISAFRKIKEMTSVNPLTPELNPSAQHCLTRFYTGDFAS